MWKPAILLHLACHGPCTNSSLQSHPSYIFVNLTYPFSKISQSHNAQKSPKKVTQNRQKVVSTVFYFVSLSIYGTSIPRKYSIFIQQLNLFHFRKILPKNRWEWQSCRETVRNRVTHGRTVTIGRSTFPIAGFHMTSLNFKLQNYWSSWDFTFRMYKSS